jgi:hypothetical protein
MLSASGLLPKHTPPPGQALGCAPEEFPPFLRLASNAFTRKGFIFNCTDEHLSAMCGFDSNVVGLIWMKYGGWLASNDVKPIELLWMLSRLKLYIPWTALGPMWGTGKTKFRERAENCQLFLLGAMNEVWI